MPRCQVMRAFDHVRLSTVSPTRMQSGVSTKDRHTINASHETIIGRRQWSYRIPPDITRTTLCLSCHGQDVGTGEHMIAARQEQS